MERKCLPWKCLLMPYASSRNMPFRWITAPPLGPRTLSPSCPLNSYPGHPLSNHSQRSEVIFSSPLLSTLVEPALAILVLGLGVVRGELGILPRKLGSPS